jgi:hypothetical protein
VSWQLATVSANPSIDLGLGSAADEEIFSIISSEYERLEPHVGHSRARTRHFLKVASGTIPNIASLNLSIQDAISIREDDSFERFRYSLNAALTAFDTQLVLPGGNYENARFTFEDEMREAPRRLAEQSKSKSYKERVKNGAWRTGLSVISTTAGHTLKHASPVSYGLVAGAFTILDVFHDWLGGRARGRDIAVRYCATLGRIRSLES